MGAVNLTINGRPVEVPGGTTILEAAQQLGIKIPTLCNDPELTREACCRLCVVEVEGARTLVPACAMAVTPGMKVQTHTPKVEEARRVILELILANHPNDCLVCEKGGTCDLQNYAYQYGISEWPEMGEKRQLPIDTENPLIERDLNKCILCGKCVRACEQMQGTEAINFQNRGFTTLASTPYNRPLSLEDCRFCGSCVAVCPTGALMPKLSKGLGRTWEIQRTQTTCPFCGTGCNFDLLTKDDRVVGVCSNPESPVNGRWLCVKGRFGWDYIHSPERLTTPLIRRNGKLEPASWDEALSYVAGEFARLKVKYGGEKAFAALSSARCTNEENYLMQKFMRAVIGSNNVDHCART